MSDLAFYVIIAIVSIIVFLNVYATYVIMTTYFEVKERRIYQIIFVWLLPLIAALMVIHINKEDRLAPKYKRKTGNDSSTSYPSDTWHL